MRSNVLLLKGPAISRYSFASQPLMAFNQLSKRTLRFLQVVLFLCCGGDPGMDPIVLLAGGQILAVIRSSILQVQN
jgi:hypothetical protein